MRPPTEQEFRDNAETRTAEALRWLVGHRITAVEATSDTDATLRLSLDDGSTFWLRSYDYEGYSSGVYCLVDRRES